jgi:hypothetical protein
VSRAPFKEEYLTLATFLHNTMIYTHITRKEEKPLKSSPEDLDI